MTEDRVIKALYAARTRPAIVTVPPLRFALLEGVGDPNKEAFAAATAALYSFSYAVRMSNRSDAVPPGWYAYTVSPLEGEWDLYDKGLPVSDKDNYRWQIVIRQPDFLTPELFERFRSEAQRRKPNPWLEQLRLVELEEGACCQMLHIGSYDDEPASFACMEAFCAETGWRRASKTHREIYLSDPRRTAPEKLKTILRFRVRPEGMAELS